MPFDAQASRYLARSGLACRDSQYSLDRSGIWWVAIAGEPATYRSGSKGVGSAVQGGSIGWVEWGSERFEQLIVVAQQPRRTGQQSRYIAICNGVQERDEFVADPVSPESRISIGWVGGECEALAAAQFPGFDSAQRQDWMSRPGGDGREPGSA